MSAIPVPAEIRGRYRLWRHAAEQQAARINQAFDSRDCGFASGDYTKRKGKGKARALKQLRRLFENADAKYLGPEGAARWAFLAPDADGPEVVASIILFDERNGCVGPWLMSFSDHSLQRAMQRSAPHLNLTDLIWSALAGAQSLNVPIMLETSSLNRIRVAAGDGAFAAELLRSDHDMPLLRARTYISRDSMSELQEARIIPPGAVGERMGDVYSTFRARWALPAIVRPRRAAPAKATTLSPSGGARFSSNSTSSGSRSPGPPSQ